MISEKAADAILAAAKRDKTNDAGKLKEREQVIPGNVI
jgi:hypothetical protein